MNILSYHVFTTRNGGLWLQDDEKSWDRDFIGSASFNDSELAKDIGAREEGPEDTIYVLACLGS